MGRYIKNILIAIDQLGNTIAGGNPDCTISARVGWFSCLTGSCYWQFLEFIIDMTFYPIDGSRHCFQSYVNDKESYRHGSTLALVGLCPIVIVACVALLPITHLIGLFLVPNK